MCLSRAATAHLRQGRRDAALALIERMTAIGREAATLTATIEAWIQHGRASLAYFSGDSAEFRRCLEAAIAGYDASGDTRAATNDRVNLGFALAAMGAYARAEELLAAAAGEAERLGLAKVSAYAWNNLGWIQMQLGHFGEAARLQRRSVDAAREQNEAFLEGSSRAYLALALCGLGEHRDAEIEARRAVDLLEPAPAVRPHALAALARALAAQARLDEAGQAAEEALAGAETLELPEDSDALVRLVAAETRHAAGKLEAARAAIAASHARILERAARIDDPALRRSFLESVPEHARTLELFDAKA
jgi:tetratricopeptide (TPR) repeat protein